MSIGAKQCVIKQTICYTLPNKVTVCYPVHSKKCTVAPFDVWLSHVTIYIYKEGVSRMVVRELLPRATAHGHQTFPDYGRHIRSRSKGGDVREEAPAEECAAKNLQTTGRHLGFTEKIYGFPRTLLCCQYKRKPQPLFANSSCERR